MKKRMLRTVTIIGTLSLALSACGAEPKPTPSESTADSVSFSDGANLPPDTDITWGDGFAHDDGWEEVEHLTEPGRWTYTNTDGTCFAAFRGGALGEAGDMNDEEASDALIAVELGEEAAEIGELLYDGSFLRHGRGDAQVAHRQFSFTVDGVSRFIAARAFVALNYSVQVMVMCDGVDVSAAAEEVLTKNMISIETADG